jgi:hypothetical protein
MFAKRSESISSSTGFAGGQVVQTAADDGQWMYLPEASDITGVSEKTLRRHIKKRVLKARRLGKRINSPLQVWITPKALKDVKEHDDAGIDVVDVLDAEFEGQVESFAPHEETDGRGDLRGLGFEVERVVRTIAQQFSEKLDEHKELITELRTELERKDRQLRLLPDFQKEAELERKSAELAVLESEALKKQIAAMSEEIERLKNPWWKSLFGSMKAKDQQS